ncbi:CRP/FNR family cyclic AMP-dependent transcriptional regulator [Amorphus suaedae]
MPETAAARNVLSTRGWLSRLPEPVRTAILDRCALRSYGPGEAVYHLGDETGGMFGLVSGSLAVMIAPREHGPYLAHLGRPGFWFGEGMAITREPRRVGVVVRRPTSLMVLPLSAIDELAASVPDFWRHVAVNAIMNLDMALRAYDDMLIASPAVRVAAILCRLAGNAFERAGETRGLRIDVTQTELSELSAMSRNAVGRILSELSARGLVDVGYGHLVIRDLAALKKAATAPG